MGRDKVGYGRPPKATQFKPGKSGNPKGRPKGSLNLVSDLAAELGEQITVREDGRTRRISKQRALIKSLLAKGIQGEVRAAAAVLALYARVNIDEADDGSTSIDDAELAILRRFAPRLLKSLIRKGDGS
jgi:Family of unknown function (DUF5681)